MLLQVWLCGWSCLLQIQFLWPDLHIGETSWCGFMEKKSAVTLEVMCLLEWSWKQQLSSTWTKVFLFFKPQTGLSLWTLLSAAKVWVCVRPPSTMTSDLWLCAGHKCEASFNQSNCECEANSGRDDVCRVIRKQSRNLQIYWVSALMISRSCVCTFTPTINMESSCVWCCWADWPMGTSDLCCWTLWNKQNLM